MGECPLQPLVPLFLVVGGLAGIIKTVLLITENIVRQKASTLYSRVRHPKVIVRMWKVGNLFFNLFLLALIITGSYWVYSIYGEAVATGYSTCNTVLYKFAFSFVTCSYVILLVMFSCTFFMAGASLRRRKAHTRTTSQARTARENGGNAESAEGTRGVADGELENVHVVSVEYGERGFEMEGVVSGTEDAETQEGGGDGTGEEADSFPPAADAVRTSLHVAGRMDMDQQAVSTGNLTSAPNHHRPQPSDLRLGTHSSELRLPDMHQQYRGPRMARSLMRFESCPYPSYPLRHASFGSNDSGLLPISQSARTSRFKYTAGPISFSQFLSQTQNANCPHSSFRSLCESYDMDPRRCSLRLPRNSSFREEGTDSNRSSLYNTVHSDGFSITAV